MFFTYYDGFSYEKSGLFVDLVNEELKKLSLPPASATKQEGKNGLPIYEGISLDN